MCRSQAEFNVHVLFCRISTIIWLATIKFYAFMTSHGLFMHDVMLAEAECRPACAGN